MPRDRLAAAWEEDLERQEALAQQTGDGAGSGVLSLGGGGSDGIGGSGSSGKQRNVRTVAIHAGQGCGAATL